MTASLSMWLLLFQHTAARRRLNKENGNKATVIINVSTHSRPKAAELVAIIAASQTNVSTHSRSKAAELIVTPPSTGDVVSTHSRSKAAD